MHKTMETELSHQATFINSIPRHKDAHRPHYRCYMDEDNMCIAFQNIFLAFTTSSVLAIRTSSFL